MKKTMTNFYEQQEQQNELFLFAPIERIEEVHTPHRPRKENGVELFWDPRDELLELPDEELENELSALYWEAAQEYDEYCREVFA